MSHSEVFDALARRVAVQFEDDAEFLACVRVLTTVIDPGVTLEVVAPRVAVMSEWHLRECRANGLKLERAYPELSWQDFKPEEARRLRRDLLVGLDRPFLHREASARSLEAKLAP